MCFEMTNGLFKKVSAAHVGGGVEGKLAIKADVTLEHGSEKLIIK